MQLKSVLICLSLLLVLSQTRTCFGTNCQFKTPLIKEQHTNQPATIADAIANQLQRSYWYYLQNGKPLYSAYIETPTRYLFFFYHQSSMGIFFTVSSYYKSEQKAQVNTMVRLGSGLGKNIRENFETQPFSLYFRTDLSERLLTLASENGQIDISEEITQINIEDVNEEIEKNRKCKQKSDKYLRETYWYYLQGATLIQDESLIRNSRRYHIFTYVNIVGTFLVISSCENQAVKANTFVRIGRGGRPQLAPAFS